MNLAAIGVTLGFPGRTLVRNASFEVQTGECWAVLGNNGSGKTTLLHTLAGIHQPSGGRVVLDGVPLSTLGASARARRIGLLPQEERVEFWGSVLDYVCLGRYPHRRSLLGWDAHDEERARAELQQMDLAHLADRALDTLSGGERQRARLAQVCTQDPAFYLLDEPLLHLDLRHQQRVLERMTGLARAARTAVVMVLHDPAVAVRCCDRALLLFESGAALAGSAAEVLSADHLERLYGVPVPL